MTLHLLRYNGPFGISLTLGRIGSDLVLADWPHSSRHQANMARLKRLAGVNSVATETSDPLLQQAAAQITEYLKGQRHTFSVPLRFYGTDFQRLVWQTLMSIDYGRTTTYGRLAQMIGRPSATRAVAMAVGSNPLSIIAPCHRVIGSDGSLTGYAGGIPVKRHLLSLESLPPAGPKPQAGDDEA